MRAFPLLFLAIFSVGHAQEIPTGPYVGIGLGQLNYDGRFLEAGFLNDSATSKKLYGGYRLTNTWAVEASWQRSDTVDESFSDGRFGPAANNGRTGLEFEAIAVRGVGYLPFSWGSFFAGLGYFDGETDEFLEGSGGPGGSIRTDASTSSDGLTALLGLQWDFSLVSLRLEYAWWDIENADALALGVGVHWRF